jgi:hypothetical protein
MDSLWTRRKIFVLRPKRTSSNAWADDLGNTTYFSR